MPKSRGRKGARMKAEATTDDRPTQKLDANPGWFVPVMVGMMVLGVLWVSVFYITSGRLPIASIGYWNLGIGMGLIMAGFVMSTRWR